MNQHEPLEQYEYDFVRETYGQDWPITVIAEKLERPPVTISAMVSYMGLKRPASGVQTTTHDWAAIWYAVSRCGNYTQAAKAIGTTKQVVSYAMRKMISMGTDERLLKWNKFALKHGREPYTFKDANGSI